MISKMVVVGNGKGGVFKSSLVANVAGMAALSGWRVLVVDTDPQDHVSLDLGVRDQSDHGVGLHAAMIRGEAPVVLHDVRPGLDLIPNGEKGAEVIGGLGQMMASGDLDRALESFESMVRPLADDYDLILVDTPPGEKVLQQVVMAAAGYVLIPTRVDKGSREGIDRVCRDVLRVTRLNPGLEILGVVPVGLSRGAKKLEQRAREQLVAAVDGVAPVFKSFIHTVDRATIDGREAGQLAYEYEAEADRESSRLAKLKYQERRRQWKAGDAKAYSAAAGGLAEDYQMLTNEVLAAFVAAIELRQEARV